MSFADIAEAIRVKFRDGVATPNSLVVVHDNQPPQSLKQSWYRLQIQEDDRVQMTSGKATARRFRISGKAVLYLYVPIAQGDGDMLVLADAVTTAFASTATTTPAVVCFNRAPMLVGAPTREDGWFMRVMHIPFDSDIFL